MQGAGSEGYAFSHWEDDTALLPSMDAVKMTKLIITQGHWFRDAAATAKHNAAFEDFKNRTPRDVSMAFSTQFNIPGLRRETLCFGDDSRPPAWVSMRWFNIASLCFCTLLYRSMLDHSVKVVRLQVSKVIGE